MLADDIRLAGSHGGSLSETDCVCHTLQSAQLGLARPGAGVCTGTHVCLASNALPPCVLADTGSQPPYRIL